MIFYSLLFIVTLEYLRPEVYFPFIKVSFFMPLFIFLISIISSGHIDNALIIKRKTTIWLIFYLFLIIISVLTADVTLYAYNYFKAAFGYFMLYFIILKSVSDINKIKYMFSLLVLIHILLLILNPDVILNPATRSYLKHTSFLGDGNDFTWSVCIVFPFTIFLFQVAKRKAIKYISIFCMVIFLMAIIGSSSRGASISLCIMLFYLWKKSKNKVKGLLILIILAISVSIFAPSSYFERMESIKDYEQEGSAQGRIMAWKSAIRMAIDHPILGVGAFHFPVKFGVEYRPDGYGRTDLAWLNAHSIYFKILGELGFPGILFLVSILLVNFKNNENIISSLIKKNTNLANYYEKLFITLNSSLIAYSVGGLFLSGINYPHLFVIAGIITSANIIYEKEMKTDKMVYRDKI